ncbi:MAG: hypothetical protein AB7U38_02200 [Hyphomicrobiales bacterium]
MNRQDQMDGSSFGGYLWFVIDVIFVVALAAALIFGIMRWRHSRLTPREKHEQREAVDRLYHPEDQHSRKTGG